MPKDFSGVYGSQVHLVFTPWHVTCCLEQGLIDGIRRRIVLQVPR
jgi:hypothetical protein